MPFTEPSARRHNFGHGAPVVAPDGRFLFAFHHMVASDGPGSQRRAFMARESAESLRAVHQRAICCAPVSLPVCLRWLASDSLLSPRFCFAHSAVAGAHHVCGRRGRARGRVDRADHAARARAAQMSGGRASAAVGGSDHDVASVCGSNRKRSLLRPGKSATYEDCFVAAARVHHPYSSVSHQLGSGRRVRQQQL